MSVAYDDDIPGLSGTHYGRDGIGILGALIPASGTDGTSIIRAATTVYPAVEYRLVGVSIPTGVRLDEDGGGYSTVQECFTCRLFADGVEL